MRNTHLSLLSILGTLLILTFFGCSPSDDEGVIIQGEVIDQQTLEPINEALVQITSPQEASNIYNRTDANGTFTLEGFDVEEVTNLEITVTSSEYEELVKNVSVTPDDDVVELNFELIAEGGNGNVPTTPSGKAASIELVEVTNETINIAATGGITSSLFTFIVQDSSGNSLDSENTVDVEFSIISGPEGGENITPTVASTNENGLVTAKLNSGNKAGVVQIEAIVQQASLKASLKASNKQTVKTEPNSSKVLSPKNETIKEGNPNSSSNNPVTVQTKNHISFDDHEITSKPLSITIHGGYPDQDHFTLEPISDTNIEGFDRNGVEITYKVRVGDEFSNPVKPGTAVYFETTGGVIQGSAVQNTDEDGYAEVTLFAGNPRPADGKGIVTARTTDGNGNDVFENSDFIFSTSKANINTDVNEIELAPGERQSVGYSVMDLNDNPMASGTTIEVLTDDSEFELTGTTSQTMTNELESGKNITDFNFTVSAPEDYEGSGSIKVIVTSPSGTVTTYQDLMVTSTGGGVSGPPAGAAVLVLEAVENSSINIKETGGIVNTSFTFQVQDSSGRALSNENPVDVDFEIIEGPGGGEGLMPTTATTNSSGRVTGNLFSGNTAGVVKIRASITREDIGLTIQSTPVAVTIHGGFPDEDFFSISPESFNFEGFNINGNENIITVIVGDKFSNPVKPGTAVYFETTGGVIQGSALDHTDELGRASVILQSANPRPLDGIATVTAKTIDENDVTISASTNVVFATSAAIIDATPTTFDLDPNGGASFDFTVEDLNGNPMPKGTLIEIETGEGIEVTGSNNLTLGDHLTPGPGKTEFSFSIRDTDDESDDPSDMTILIKVTTPEPYSSVTTYDEISGTRRKVQAKN